MNKHVRILLFFLCISFVKYGFSTTTKEDRPNILIILTDDQGYGDFSFTGNPILKTPNIDRLSEEGVQFTDFHVAPMCTPTRGQLMTGIDALHNGAFLACSGYSFIYPEIPTMPEILAGEGYRTGLFGKWHLGDNYPYRPFDRGFETAIWHMGWGITSTTDYWNNDYFDDFYYTNDSLTQFDGYCTDIWFDEAMKWMQECADKDEPFFAYLSTNAPHGPLYVEDRYREPFKSVGESLASFFGMIANLDENMGRLEEMLDESGLKENTIVIFMTDNGGTVGVNYYNAGLRDGKMSVYEGGHRVPCILRWPDGELSDKKEIPELVEIQDILPTVLDLCNIKTNLEFDGQSVAGLVKGKKQKELDSRMLVVQYGRQPWVHLEMPKEYDACVMWKKWRLVNGKELYNISDDLSQKNNVANKNPEIVKHMLDYYEKYWSNAVYDVYNKFNPIYIGVEAEKETVLTSHDWLTLNTANQDVIRNAQNRSGAWNVRVVEEGNYQIELCRWPKEANLKLRDEAPEYQAVDDVFKKGKALPIARANLRIGIQEYTTPVNEDDSLASFNLYLKEGDTQLQTFFYDKGRNRLCGAYYVYITRK